MTKPLDISAIRERLEKASPGPWMLIESVDARNRGYIRPDPLEPAICKITETGRVKEWRANASLIAHAPSDLKALLEEVETLRQQLTLAQAEISRLKDKVRVQADALGMSVPPSILEAKDREIAASKERIENLQVHHDAAMEALKESQAEQVKQAKPRKEK